MHGFKLVFAADRYTFGWCACSCKLEAADYFSAEIVTATSRFQRRNRLAVKLMLDLVFIVDYSSENCLQNLQKASRIEITQIKKKTTQFSCFPFVQWRLNGRSPFFVRLSDFIRPSFFLAFRYKRCLPLCGIDADAGLKFIRPLKHLSIVQTSFLATVWWEAATEKCIEYVCKEVGMPRWENCQCPPSYL